MPHVQMLRFFVTTCFIFSNEIIKQDEKKMAHVKLNYGVINLKMNIIRECPWGGP